MGSESGPPKASAVGPIIIACAFAEASKVRQVAASLGKQGYTVEVVSGVEVDPRALSAVSDRCRSQGVYVLCRSKDLDRDKVEALREVLLAHRVPFGRTITVATTSARELEERIEQGLARAATVRPPTPTRAPIETKAVAERPTLEIAPATIAAALVIDPNEDEDDGDGEPITQTLPAFRSEPAEDDTVVDAEDETVAEAAPAAPPPTEASLTDLEATELEPDEISIDPEPSISVQRDALDLDFADIDALDSRRGMPAIRLDRTQVGPPPQPDVADRTAVGTAPAQPLITGLTVPVPAIPRAQAIPDPAPGRGDAAPAPWNATARSKRSFPIKAVVGVLSAAGVIAILWSFVRGEHPTTDDSASADAKSGADDESALAKSGVGPDAGKAGTGGAVDRSEKPSASEDGADESAAGGGPTRVGAALRQRSVRALDILLIASRPSKPLVYSAAEQHCAGLDIEGLRGWRLPEVGELGSLWGAGMVGRGTYWSHTAGDTFGDMRLVWNGKNGRIQPRVKESLALCVRGERATQ